MGPNHSSEGIFTVLMTGILSLALLQSDMFVVKKKNISWGDTS
jgi:hypothetical protein